MAIVLEATGGPQVAAGTAQVSDTLAEAAKFQAVFGLELAGRPWDVTGAVPWGYVSGVQPQTFPLLMTKRFADFFAKNAAGEISLKMSGKELVGGGGEAQRVRPIEKEFKRLQLHTRPPGNFEQDFLILEDDRWRWGRPNVTRDYNMARKSNDLVTLAGVVIQRQNLLREARKYFRTRTLAPDNRPWTALQIAFDVLTRVLKIDTADIITNRASKTEFVPMNESVDGESAASVIARMLTLDGNDLFIDEDGKVVIYDRHAVFDDLEFRELFPRGVPPRFDGALHVVDYEKIRPSVIETQNTPELEMLFTFQSVGPQTSASGRPANTDEEAKRQLQTGQVFVENVTKTIIDGQVFDANGEPLPAGTIVNINDAIESLGDRVGASFTLDDVLEFLGNDAFIISQIITRLTTGLEVIFDPTNTSIAQAILTDLRTFFRIPQVVVEHIRSLQAYHVNIGNTQTRTRPPSNVFSQVSWFIPTSLLVAAPIPDGVVLDSFTEINDDGSKTALTKYQPLTGVTVRVEDFDLGLYRINWAADPDRPGAVKGVTPGIARDDSIYSREQGGNVTVLEDTSFTGIGLIPDWEATVVMTVVPDLTNDKNRLFRTLFTPPPGKNEKGQDRPQVGRGPRVERRVRLDTARFQLAPGPYSQGDPVPLSTNPSAAVLGARGGMVNEKILGSVNQAESDRLYHTFTNQAEGDITLAFNKTSARIKPVASLRTVQYVYNEDGLIFVRVSAQRSTNPPNILIGLPADVLKSTIRQLGQDDVRVQG